MTYKVAVIEYDSFTEADIIDLQAARQKVAEAKSIVLEGTSGSETVVEEGPDVIHSPAKDLH